jgi:nitrogenase-associated protein
MARIIFWEKPGCAGNARQKALLKASGHTLEVRNLLAEDWTVQELAKFFAGLAIPDCINRNAPAIKSGSLNFRDWPRDAVLSLMTREPLLIRRPLMRVGEERRVGFDLEMVREWIGLWDAGERDLETCPREAVAEVDARGCHER